MRTRFIISLCTCAATLMAVGTSAASADLGPARSIVKPLTGVSAANLNKQITAGATVPMWSSTIRSPVDGKTYAYTMIGKNPLIKQSSPVTAVPTNVIPVALHFVGGPTFDPTATSPGCLPTGQTADSLLLTSPIFKTHAYAPGGTSVGTVQYIDAFQRENFAKYDVNAGAINPGYHVNVTAISHAKITVNVPAVDWATLSGGCTGTVGDMDINFWDNYVQKTLLPSLKAVVTPTHFPFFEFSNVVMYQNGNPNDCCVLGYHAAFASSTFGGAVQTYGVGDYDSTGGGFTNLSDIGAISHEVGEWMDDPTGNNATPLWGHIGQVTGCQGNLEVGDPLSGTTPIAIAMPNKVTYHAQELAFRDWFYRTPSVGLHGWFSSNGHFTTSAGPVC